MSADVSPSVVDLAHEADFEIGGARVRPSIREIESSAARETLEPRVMRVLIALARRLGQVVSRDELLETCWDGRIVGDDAINVGIAKVRRAGEAHGAFEIETIPRVGYRMNLPAKAQPAGRPRLRFIWPLVAALAVLLLVVVGGAFGYSRWSADQALKNPRVAVLPFEALSGDADARAFAAAADTEIAGALNEGQLQAGRGPGRAAFTVTGAVRSSPGQLHVRVSLVDTASGIILWSTEFSRAKDAVAGLPRDIAGRTFAVVNLAVSARREARDLDPRTLGLFIKALDGIGLPGSQAASSIASVAERAPRFASGRAAHAHGLMQQAMFAPEPQFSRLRARAVGEAEAALRSNPRHAHAHAVLSGLMEGRDWGGREARLGETPVPLGREGAVNGGMLAFLTNSGRLDEAARLGRQISARAPTPGAAMNVDLALYWSGAPEEALALVNRDLAIRPRDTLLQQAKLQIAALGGFYDAAAEALAEPPVGEAEVGPGTIEAFRAFVAARRSGDPDERAAAIRLIMSAAGARRLLRAHAIPMLNDLGALDEAFQLAETYVRDPIPNRMGATMNSGFLFGPDTVAMRRDPRFIPLVETIGLLDYWRTSGHWPDFCENEPQSVCAEMRRGTGS